MSTGGGHVQLRKRIGLSIVLEEWVTIFWVGGRRDSWLECRVVKIQVLE